MMMITLIIHLQFFKEVIPPRNRRDFLFIQQKSISGQFAKVVCKSLVQLNRGSCDFSKLKVLNIKTCCNCQQCVAGQYPVTAIQIVKYSGIKRTCIGVFNTTKNSTGFKFYYVIQLTGIKSGSRYISRSRSRRRFHGKPF